VFYHSEFAVGSANIREGGVPANPENGVVARSAVGSSFPIHGTEEKDEGAAVRNGERRNQRMKVDLKREKVKGMGIIEGGSDIKEKEGERVLVQRRRGERKKYLVVTSVLFCLVGIER